MENSIFRKTSMDRISSPEKLDDYLKVTTPSLWFVMTAVILLLIGVFVWSSVGELEDSIKLPGLVENGMLNISGETAAIQEGMTVRIGGKESTLEIIGSNADGSLQYAAPFELPDGSYTVTVVTDHIHPIRFLFN
ncbi:MAG: hypothetical protein K6C08_06185 [Oscillospiraceae bacterium]|nr:hypothetical protein [Oscillospiraceae bacterium]